MKQNVLLILENSSRNFSEISVFWGVTDQFLEKNIHFVRNFNFHIWMRIPEIGFCHAPELAKYNFSTECSILD